MGNGLAVALKEKKEVVKSNDVKVTFCKETGKFIST
jgi:hypothetical protein